MIILENKKAHLYAQSRVPLLKTLSEPLKNFLGIDYFGCKRYYPSLKKYIFISTNEGWLDHHLSHIASHGHFFSQVMSSAPENEIQCIPWPEKPTDEFLRCILSHGMWHGINFYLKTSHYIDLWTFSTSPSYEQFRFLRINLIEDLKKFILHFSHYSEHFFELSSQDCLASLPLEKTISSDSLLLPKLREFRSQFNYCPFLCVDNHFIKMTKREAQCLHELSLGRSMKECAYSLGISPRTVEEHLTNIKKKGSLFSKSALLACYFQTISKFNIKI